MAWPGIGFTSASCRAYRIMNGVPIPGVSAGSNQVGASEMCTAHVICPSGPAAAGNGASVSTARRSTAATGAGLMSFALQLHVFVGCRERVAGDEADAGLVDTRAHAVQPGVQPDGRDHRLVVNELLDPVQHRLAPLGVELGGLLPEEPVDVRVAAGDVGTAGGHERLDAGGRVAEGAAAALDQPLELLLGPAPEEGHPFDRPQPHPDPDRVEIVDDGLADVGDGGVAEVVAGVEAVGIAGLGQELAGPRRIASEPGRLPVELETAGDEAPVD